MPRHILYTFGPLFGLDDGDCHPCCRGNSGRVWTWQCIRRLQCTHYGVTFSSISNLFLWLKAYQHNHHQHWWHVYKNKFDSRRHLIVFDQMFIIVRTVFKMGQFHYVVGKVIVRLTFPLILRGERSSIGYEIIPRIVIVEVVPIFGSLLNISTVHPWNLHSCIWYHLEQWKLLLQQKQFLWNQTSQRTVWRSHHLDPVICEVPVAFLRCSAIALWQFLLFPFLVSALWNYQALRFIFNVENEDI